MNLYRGAKPKNKITGRQLRIEILQGLMDKGIRFVKSEVLQDAGENEFWTESAGEFTLQYII